MAVSAELYANFFSNSFGANIPDMEGEDNLECMLLDSNHTFDEADEFVEDISANEIDDDDYSRQPLDNVAVTQNTNEINVDADDITFGDSVSISANYAVIYALNTDDDDSPLLFHVDFDGEEESVDGEFTLQVDDNGLFDVVT